MPPAVERLVRLMVMLPPDQREPLWESVTADCGDLPGIWSLRWHVGDAAKMWPEGAPRTLAETVLASFGDPSDKTLRLPPEAILGKQGAGPQAGAAWATRAREAAADVLAEVDSLEEVLQQAKENLTLRSQVLTGVYRWSAEVTIRSAVRTPPCGTNQLIQLTTHTLNQRKHRS